MLTTLIRLMGAWIAVYGLFFGTHFIYLLKHEASGMHIFLAFLPSLVSLFIGLGYVAFAPRIAGNKDLEVAQVPDILSSGLILLGVYWLGSGLFQGVGNINFYQQIFDPSRIEFFPDAAFWGACGNFLQAAGGLALLVVGNKMRLPQHAGEVSGGKGGEDR